jgi:hypothetical protein
VRLRAGRLPPKRASASGAYASPLQRGFDGLEAADSDDPVMLADDAEASIVEYCWEHADKPPKLRGAGLGLLGENILRPPTIMGARPGGASSPAHRRAYEGSSRRPVSGECPRCLDPPNLVGWVVRLVGE